MRTIRNYLHIFLIALCFTASAALATTTDNKGYELMTTGSNRGTWGVTLNDIFTIIDKNVGGRVSVSVAGSSNVTATAGDAQYLWQKLTGTITANIEYILPDKGGFYIIENATSGAFTLKITNTSGGTGVIVPSGLITLVYSNATDNKVETLTYLSGALTVTNNLSDVASASTAFSNIKQAASESATGVVELATTAEAAAGTDTTRAVTSAGVAAALAAVAQAVPTGIVLPYAGSTAPTGYLLSYGQAISRTTYASLFAVVGTTYGVGDGSTTFNLPDCRGRVIAGKDDMGGVSANRLTGLAGSLNGDTLGATGGAETHTLTVAEIPAHTHTVPMLTNQSSSTGGATHYAREDGTSTFNSGSSGGGGAHVIVQPTIIMNCIIKQ